MQDSSKYKDSQNFNNKINTRNYLIKALSIINVSLVNDHRADNAKTKNGDILWKPYRVVDEKDRLPMNEIMLVFPRFKQKDISVYLHIDPKTNKVFWESGKYSSILTPLGALKRVCKLSIGNPCTKLCSNVDKILNIFYYLDEIGLLSFLNHNIYGLGLVTIDLKLEILRNKVTYGKILRNKITYDIIATSREMLFYKENELLLKTRTTDTQMMTDTVVLELLSNIGKDYEDLQTKKE